MATPGEIAFIKLMCVLADLRGLDHGFRVGDPQGRFFHSVRQAFVALVNADDVRREVAPLLRASREVVVRSRELGRRLEPVRHLRNAVGGHLSGETVAIVLREEPILLKSGMTDDAIQHLAGVRLLDAALNGHLDPAGVPLVFKGDTDLVYPPDMERFVTWLQEIIGDTMSFLSAAIEAVRPQVTFVDSDAELMTRYLKAGEGPAGRPPER